MAVLSKATIQRLATLRTLSLWRRGAYGPVRLHKVLFFADNATNEPDWRLFTFKKWRLGQYSDDVSSALNALHDVGRITSLYDGPSERIRAELSPSLRKDVAKFFEQFFSAWNRELKPAFNKWAYLTNDGIVQKAHDDPSYTKNQHGDTIFKSFECKHVEFQGLDDDLAETLADLVDPRLHRGIRKRLADVAKLPVTKEDWRHIYFGEPQTEVG